MPPKDIELRNVLYPDDIQRIEQILRPTGLFSEEEIRVALELLQEKLAHPTSSYQFLFAERKGHLLGYTCFGRIPCTTWSFDLYWIGVDPECRRAGIGRLLLNLEAA